MSKKHTPGPWKPVEFGGVQIGGGKNFEEAVCTMWDSRSKRGIANARLIAAAPDGADFATAFLAYIERTDLNDLDFGRGLRNSGLIEQARAFVARIDGEEAQA